MVAAKNMDVDYFQFRISHGLDTDTEPHGIYTDRPTEEGKLFHGIEVFSGYNTEVPEFILKIRLDASGGQGMMPCTPMKGGTASFAAFSPFISSPFRPCRQAWLTAPLPGARLAGRAAK